MLNTELHGCHVLHAQVVLPSHKLVVLACSKVYENMKNNCLVHAVVRSLNERNVYLLLAANV